MTNLNVGDHAPDFTLPRDGGGTVSLADFAGRNVIVYFYPKDDTSGCTTEALEFTALLPAFSAKDTDVIGISPDTVERHDKFSAKHKLGVILGSDASTQTAQAYGVWKEKSMYGRTYMGIERTTFLIGPDGRIRTIWAKVKVAGHADAVLASLSEA